MLDKIELAWAAGFFDGEGCTMFTGQHRLRMVINQTNRQTLERFQRAVGAGKISGPYQNRGNRKEHWQWHASGQQAFDSCAKLFDYLCEPKQDQMLEAISKRKAFEELVNARSNPGALKVVA